MTKSATKAEGQAAPLKTPTQPAPGTRPVSSSANYPFATLQRTFGNQAMLELLESGGIQAKLRVSQPGDADESEADRVANHIVSSSYAPKLQRKCACSRGAFCSKCAGEEEERKVHRGVFAAPFIQRATTDSTTTHLHHDPRELTRPAQLIVEDNATKLERGQMKKSAFLKQLKVAVSITADAALAASRKAVKSSPYIEQWLAPYAEQDSQQLEQALIKYAPEAARVHSAHEYIAIISSRVERAVINWAKTGKITGVPEDLAKQFTSGGGTGGFFGALQSFASSGVGGAILGFLGGGASSQVQRKEKGGGESSPRDAASVQAQLGSGHPLDSRVQSQMSSAFGYDFASVRVHTDAQSAALSASLDARAFTIGKNVAFASGEYQPGTLIGDALIAHELAHVVQQGGGQASAPLTKSESQGGQLEEDADLSAVGAVASLWAGSMRGLANLKQNAGPRLRSGLRLQRCSCAENLPALRDPKQVLAGSEKSEKEVMAALGRSGLESAKSTSDPAQKTAAAQAETEVELDLQNALMQLRQSYQEELQDAGTDETAQRRAQKNFEDQVQRIRGSFELQFQMSLKYGVVFKTGKQRTSFQLSSGLERWKVAAWSKDELQTIDKVLARLPQKYLDSFKQRAKAIQREPGIGGTAAGSWEETTGTLAIYNAGFDDPDKLVRYLLHEIGHSTVQEQTVGHFAHLPPQEWMNLSDWRFSTRDSLARDLQIPAAEVAQVLARLDKNAQVVQNFPRAISIGSRMVIHDKYENRFPPTQFFHYAVAHNDEFVSDYARSHPAEDLAESFAFYMVSPEPTKRQLDVGPPKAMNKWKYLTTHYPERLKD